MNPKLKRVSWFFFGLFCLIFFTIIKLPREPIKNSLHTMIADALAAHGASFSTSEEKLSLFLLPSYQLKKVTLTLPSPSERVNLDEVNVSPLLLPLFLGKLGGEVQIQAGQGTLRGSMTVRKTLFSTSFQAEKFDLGRLGVIPLFLGIQASSLIEGNGSLSTDAQAFNLTQGKLNLNLSKLLVDAQSIAGFAIPKLVVSEALLQATIQDGKAKISNLRLGKSGASGTADDDVRATISGEITLGKTFEASTLNLKTKFSFSENFLKSFMLLDAILGAGKQSDGSYAFNLTGSVANPIPQPLAQNGGT